ncbi:VOC family protein [Flocculibacter collagenilyticus]|uniref:VOC family protein n=1 Tax=Flocculibacter collagenilyticus TaxID=2744479 RepID=UPI0018F67D0E|nr:hypothetical protein [Flocculibacter collagenilyticus]
MQVLGIRFCAVTDEAQDLAHFLNGLGLTERKMGDCDDNQSDSHAFSGAIFPAGEHSWVEVWQSSSQMPAGIMLQIIVDDAEAFAAHAKQNKIEVQGPMKNYGETIYFAEGPSGLKLSFQSKDND